MDDPLRPLRTKEALQQFALLTDWLSTRRPQLIQPDLEVMSPGTELFRLTRAPNEAQARVMLGRRPAFFATTKTELSRYQHFADLGAKGRLVIIRGTLLARLNVTSADQPAITRIIFTGDTTDAGERIESLSALQPGPDGSEDTMTIRIQRWVVPIVVRKVLGFGFGGLRRTGLDELTVAKPLNLDLTFDWQDS